MKLPKIKISEIPFIAKACKKAGRIFSLYGQGGTGKTTVLKTHVAPALDIAPQHVYIVNLSGSSPQEALGYGIPDAETRDMYFSRPEIWPTVEKVPAGTPAMLVLDEFTDYDLSVQSLLRGVYSPFGGPGMVGSHTLTPDLFIATTGNRRMDGSSRSSVPPAPFVERAFSFELLNDLDSFLDYAFSIPDICESPLLAFLAFQNGLNDVDHYCPRIVMPYDGSPHPCPRSWEAAMEAERALEADPAADSSHISAALRSTLGEQTGTAANAFRETVFKDLPLIKKIEHDGKNLLELNDDGAIGTDCRANQYGLIFTAIRKCLRDYREDLEAALHDGKMDWLIDRMILKAHADVAGWAYEAGCSAGLPLDQHPKRKDMQKLI